MEKDVFVDKVSALQKQIRELKYEIEFRKTNILLKVNM